MSRESLTSTIHIRPVTQSDGDWVHELLVEFWGSSVVVSRGRLHYADRLPGFIAHSGVQLLGLATYHIEEDRCELVSLNARREGVGIGGLLIGAVRDAARKAGCHRLWLITTNDNVAAIEFYKRRGFTLEAVYEGAVDEARRLKPEIPAIGISGVPIRDEIELGMVL